MINDLVGASLIVHGKGGKDRVVPLTPALASELADLDGCLFPGRTDQFREVTDLVDDQSHRWGEKMWLSTGFVMWYFHAVN